jgi:hypothetical protein
MSRTALLGIGILLAGCGLLGVGTEAPPECGFPDGTALSFAGRSTTDTLGVSEAPGTAMSREPADIYITRDAFPQGDLRGRLVCAIYVNQGGFVEVTVHPDDGGLVAPVEPTPRPTPPPDGLAQDEAVSAATADAPAADGWELLGAMPATVAEVAPDPESDGWARDLAPDRWVWFVQFARDDLARDVFVDYFDGSVLGSVEYISN